MIPNNLGATNQGNSQSSTNQNGKGFNPWEYLFGGLGLLGFGEDGSGDGLGPFYQHGEQDINNAVKQGQQYLNPFYKTGIQDLGIYQKMLGNLSDPGAFYQKMMSGFKETPAQQYQKQQALNAVSNNAAVKGLLGSTQQAQGLEKTAALLSQQNQQQYFNNLMNIYGKALGGYQGMQGEGFGAGEKMGEYGMQGAEDLAQLESLLAQERAAEEAARDRGMGDLFGGLGGLLGLL